MLLSKEAVCKSSCGVHTASNSYTVKKSPCGTSYGRGRSLLVVECSRLNVLTIVKCTRLDVLTCMKSTWAEIISGGNRSIGLVVGAQVIVVSWTVINCSHNAFVKDLVVNQAALSGVLAISVISELDSAVYAI